MIDLVDVLASEGAQNEERKEVLSSILNQINALNRKIERLEAWKSKVEGRRRRFMEDNLQPRHSNEEPCQVSRQNNEPHLRANTGYELQVLEAASKSGGKHANE